MRNILVTGGCGFMFSNFIRYMLQKYDDYRITNLDALTYCGRLENTKDFMENKNYEFIRGDICDSEIVNEIVKEADVIVHAAAESFVDKSIINGKDFIQTNVYGTYNLLEAARKNNIEKFIFISTDEIYGSTNGGSFKETSQINPTNPYSASKAGADRLAYSFFKTYGTPVVITRSCNNFGPYQFPEKFIPLFITNLLEEKKVPLYGDGSNVREWLHVQDNCEATDFILHNGKIGEAYNIGSGFEKSNKEITEIILKELGKDESYINYVKDRLGHDFRYSMDSSKLSQLGWKPKLDFNETLKQTIGWYKKNKQWWEELRFNKL